MLVDDSDAELDGVRIANTTPATHDGPDGEGLAIQRHAGTATATVRGCEIDHCAGAGIAVIGADATIDTTSVHDTQSNADGTWGLRVLVVGDGQTGQAANVALTSCTIERNHQAGIGVIDSTVTVDATTVADTAPDGDGGFADGIAVERDQGSPTLTVTGSRIENSARAGIATFGGVIAISTTTLECNALALDGEPSQLGAVYTYADGGRNVCGCSGQTGTCTPPTTGIPPPWPSP